MNATEIILIAVFSFILGFVLCLWLSTRGDDDETELTAKEEIAWLDMFFEAYCLVETQDGLQNCTSTCEECLAQKARDEIADELKISRRISV